MRNFTIAALGLLMLATPAFAHHPFESEFDAKAPITLKGKITDIQWTSPHVVFKMEAPDAEGKMKSWDLEAASPEEMIKMGWTAETIKTGDEVTVQAYQAKAEGSSVVAARNIELPDGTKMSSAGNDGGPNG